MAPAPAAGDPFEALGDPNRREILRLLSDGDKPVRAIADAMTISRPAVSRHLRVLKEAGMVTEEARGTRRIYHRQERGMHAVQAYLEGIWARPPSGSGCWPRTCPRAPTTGRNDDGPAADVLRRRRNRRGR
jgi:DNA-binding transcriptional ArsR family regulator